MLLYPCASNGKSLLENKVDPLDEVNWNHGVWSSDKATKRILTDCMRNYRRVPDIALRLRSVGIRFVA